MGELGKRLIAALDPDAVVQAALATARAAGITRTEDTLLPGRSRPPAPNAWPPPARPSTSPELRDEIENARREREQFHRPHQHRSGGLLGLCRASRGRGQGP